MRYLQEGIGEITREEFEAILGPNVRVEQPPAGAAGYVATVEALEVTAYDAHTSCIVRLGVAPPQWLAVIRQNAGYMVIQDWKFEQGLHFCPVEIGGGKYDAGAGDTGPFTVSLGNTSVGGIASFVVRGVGWKAGTNHQHPNIHATIRYVEEPGPPEPPPEPPPDGLRELVLRARARLYRALADLDRALELRP